MRCPGRRSNTILSLTSVDDAQMAVVTATSQKIAPAQLRCSANRRAGIRNARRPSFEPAERAAGAVDRANADFEQPPLRRSNE